MQSELPFVGPRFNVGDKVRVRPEYYVELKNQIDVRASYVVKGVKEVRVDRMIFEGQPDDIRYRYQIVEIEGVKFTISSDRFELFA